jgi:hypothetical protein
MLKYQSFVFEGVEYTRIRAFMSKSVPVTDSVSGTEVRKYLASNGIVESSLKLTSIDEATGDTEEDLMYYVSSDQYEAVRQLMVKYYS